MLLLRRPARPALQRFLQSQASAPFSYPQPGLSRSNAAFPGYVVDHNRVRLGQGAETFQRAVSALRRWEQFRVGWVELLWPEAPIEPGTVVGIFTKQLGFHTLNACRIVYVLDEAGPPRRFGFAYGTLPRHAERGEERFLIEWDPADDSVHYDIYAYSRPKHPLARLAYPLARHFQKRFARGSKAAMLRAVAHS